MKQSPKLEIRQGQQLIMTPQLQQAIKLLQLTNLELAEFVEEQLEENPFLERDERADIGDADREPSASRDEEMARATDHFEAPTQADDTPGEAGAGDWSGVSGRSGIADGEFDAVQNAEVQIGLHDHLTHQLHLSTTDEVTLLVGAHLIDLIDDGGYLREETEVIALRLGIDRPFVEKTLSLIQTFDPSGVGARSLQECLRLQLRDLGELDERISLFIDNLDLLAAHKLPALRRAVRINEEELKALIATIRKLDPKPGLAFGGEAVQLVIPDVHVTEASDGGWKVELNAETLPKVIANERYFSRLSSADNGAETRSFLNEHMATANWLVKSLDQRARTILRVATEIVKYQDEFLVRGIRYLRPLNLKTIAEKIEMHESTVSRVTSNKYISTPRGTFEMKYFFTPSISSKDGDVAYSAESVRHRIRELIEAEDPTNPLSDDRLVTLLAGEDFDIARRTVAKYREALGLPSSVKRRRLAQSVLR
ncbi:DNA-directed RNA polymerase subunit N [Parvularcula bermudensis HTCC2503]|uniref:RNA polymerase sigma-54 factor n=1 Tax=Parvularcula bermudensis (strain ATCC BAA-594 / HTCC2503 / KCTC 12087) TaxID=314260 RepID=E0THP2_PARBH|nr:RNA polymerase factor sigma-54 [Parvularcula bermudensis]ADM09338.1 DNA-directed RNA polymerase subunit N [Parvularcula bermudensis HTCC2503]